MFNRFFSEMNNQPGNGMGNPAIGLAIRSFKETVIIRTPWKEQCKPKQTFLLALFFIFSLEARR